MSITTVLIGNLAMTVYLNNGTSIKSSYTLWPRLSRATHAERSNYRLIGDGEGIHWPSIDEDISLQNLLEGKGYAKV